MWILFSPFRRAATPLAAALLLAGTLLLSAGASAQAATRAPLSRACSLANGEKLGPTYVEKLSVTNVSCGSADTLITAYNSCRLKHGGVKGRCTAKVSGYACSEKRYSGSPDQFIAVVACKKARDAVNFTYSEDTPG